MIHKREYSVVSLVKPSLTCERIGETVFHPSLLVMEAEKKVQGHYFGIKSV